MEEEAEKLKELQAETEKTKGMATSPNSAPGKRHQFSYLWGRVGCC